MLNFNIKPLPEAIVADLEHKINFKTKPSGSLGKLEQLALKIGRIQNTLNPELTNPTIIVFASDHGIAEEGVSLFPQEVTYQMVLNFLNGGAAINVFSRQHGIDIKVVDAGVKFDFKNQPGLTHAKIGNSTKSFLREPAMTESQCIEAIEKGSNIVDEVYKNGCNIIGFGEMGIANTSPASMLLSLFCNIPIDKCVGRGTGLDDDKLMKKKAILQKALETHTIQPTPLSILSTFGGFEIAMMSGAMLKAAELGMTLIIDGFISTSALLAASKFNARVLDYCIYAHQSNEQGHILMLKYLNADPLVNLDLRLGEGTGAAIVYPIIKSAVAFLNEMASFESANVSEKGVTTAT